MINNYKYCFQAQNRINEDTELAKRYNWGHCYWGMGVPIFHKTDLSQHSLANITNPLPTSPTSLTQPNSPNLPLS